MVFPKQIDVGPSANYLRVTCPLRKPMHKRISCASKSVSTTFTHALASYSYDPLALCVYTCSRTTLGDAIVPEGRGSSLTALPT